MESINRMAAAIADSQPAKEFLGMYGELKKAMEEAKAPVKPGTEVGEWCHRDGCDGKIYLHQEPDTSCSCHLSAPCHACTSAHHRCDMCDWSEKDDHGS